MGLGNNLLQARKKCGLSQEQAAEQLGVSRQTISKWELDETLPDIQQAKKMAELYHVTLDELTEFDGQLREIQDMIQKTSEETIQKIDWTKLWAEQYPVLASYPQEVDTQPYAAALEKLLAKLQRDQGYSGEDAFLVLKDILAQLYNGKQQKQQ